MQFVETIRFHMSYLYISGNVAEAANSFLYQLFIRYLCNDDSFCKHNRKIHYSAFSCNSLIVNDCSTLSMKLHCVINSNAFFLLYTRQFHSGVKKNIATVKLKNKIVNHETNTLCLISFCLKETHK